MRLNKQKHGYEVEVGFMAQTVPEEDSDLEDDSENDDSGFRYKPDKD